MGFLYDEGKGVEQSYKKALEWYEKSAEGGSTQAQCNLGQLYYMGDGVKQDYKTAIKYFRLAIEGDEPNEEAFYYLGDCYHNGFGIDDWGESREKREGYQREAKGYYEKAIELGYNCQYALEMLRVDLKEYKDGEMRKYAKEFVADGIYGRERINQIEKDLQEEFGEVWSILGTNAQKALISGVFSYINFFELGEDCYKYLDFTPSITAMSKTLEIILGKYFFTGYLRYLHNRGISASVFDAQSCFLKVDRDESGLELSREYRKETETACFTLGSFSYVIESRFEVMEKEMSMAEREDSKRSVPYRRKTEYVKSEDGGQKVRKKGERTISRYIADYADLLFAKDAFSEGNRQRDIVNYLIDLAHEVYMVKQHRNSAAHGETMSCSHAEVCGDYLIKVRRLIYGFLSKIKPEYRKEFVITKDKKDN